MTSRSARERAARERAASTSHHVSRIQRRDAPLLTVITLWLATLLAALSLVRIFRTRELVPLVIASATIPFAAGSALRTLVPRVTRGLLGLLLHVFVSTAAIAALLAVRLHRDGIVYDRAMPRAGWDAVRASWHTIPELKTPVAAQLGFALMIALATWGVAMVADVVAFRLGSEVEALLPAVIMPAVSAAIARHAAPHTRVLFAGALVAVGVVHVACVAARQRDDQRVWLGRQPSWARPLVVGGACAAGLGAAVLTIAPRAGLDRLRPRFDITVSNEPNSSRVVTSPLVSMKRQLLQLTDDEQFTVRSVDANGAPARAYWRQTALDDFDGKTWSRKGSFTSISARGRLPGDGLGGAAIAARVRITGLEGVWLPAPYRPTSIDASAIPSDGRISFDPATGSLITARSSVQGIAYIVQSRAPTTEVIEDRLVGSGPDASTALALPADFPADVRALAVELTQNETTAYAKARAIQDHLRTFTYTTAVPAPSSLDDLRRFLFVDRAGYCEQFAGAFAALARAVGIPARVAVGYTPGRFDASDGLFHVSGRNAHAWPEILLADAGWVAFEPTPGRGIPGATAYTGVPDQDTSEGITPAPVAPLTASTIAAAPDTIVPGTGSAPSSTLTAGDHRWSVRLAGAALGALVLVVSALTLPSLVRRWSRARARAAGPGPTAELAWRVTLGGHALLGDVPSAGESPASFAERVTRADGADAAATPAASVAAVLNRARYAPAGSLDQHAADGALASADAFAVDIKADLPLVARAFGRRVRRAR